MFIGSHRGSAAGMADTPPVLDAEDFGCALMLCAMHV